MILGRCMVHVVSTCHSLFFSADCMGLQIWCDKAGQCCFLVLLYMVARVCFFPDTDETIGIRKQGKDRA